MTADTSSRQSRKVREGIVTSDRMNATVVVTISERVKHPLYKKYVSRTSKLHAHNGNDEAKVGDRVRVMETRPMSKTKRSRVTEVVERAK